MNESRPGNPGPQRTNGQGERGLDALVKSVALTLSLCFLLAGCQPKTLKVDFTESVTLDPVGGNPVNNPDNKLFERCGLAPFTINYTNAADAKFGVLEVTNTGTACKVNVRIAEDVGGVMGMVAGLADYDVETGIGNITTFIMPDKDKKLVITFTCPSSTAAGACKYSYKFSTGKGAATPAKEFVVAESRDGVTGVTASPTPAVPPGNRCITEAPVVRVITNKTVNGTMRVDFTADSKCRCDPFVVFAEPASADPKKSQRASAAAGATAIGFVELAAGQTTMLKVKCEGGNITNETCKGDVKDIRISLTIPQP